MRAPCAALDAVRDQRPPPAGAICELEAQGERAGGGVEQAYVHAYRREVGMRREVHEFQGIAAPCLEVHRLPHAPRVSVPLLSLELEGVGRVVHADDEPRSFAGTRACQLEGEWGVATLVLAQLVAIEPCGGAPVRRPEHEKHTAASPRLWHGDVAGVPPDVAAIGNPGEWRSPRERHEGLSSRGNATAGPAVAFATVVRIECELPAAVEIEPLGALEVGPWVFGKRICWALDERQDYAEARRAKTHAPRFSIKKRRRPRWRAPCLCCVPRWLRELDDVLRRRALLALHDFELDALAFGE